MAHESKLAVTERPFNKANDMEKQEMVGNQELKSVLQSEPEPEASLKDMSSNP